MVVKIRLARMGKRNTPFYNIVVAKARTARNSRPIEVIGTYDPIPKQPAFGQGPVYKDIQLDQTRARYWLGVGAQPTDVMRRLLAMLGLIQPSLHVLKAQRRSAELVAEMGGVELGQVQGQATSIATAKSVEV